MTRAESIANIERLKNELRAALLDYSEQFGWMTDEDAHLMITLLREPPKTGQADK